MYKWVCVLLFPTVLYGQSAQETIDEKLRYATELCSAIDQNNAIIATPYIRNYTSIAGSPFWTTDVWCSAEVLYKNRLFPLSQLKYESANDVMVFPSFTETGVVPLNLIPPLYSDVFINIPKSDKTDTEKSFKREHFMFYPATKEEKSEGIPLGYYHYIIEKPISLLGKYTSSIVERGSQKIFVTNESYFVYNKGKILPIKKVSNIVAIFPASKDIIMSFAESLDITPETTLSLQDMKKIIEYLNHISVQ